jgi:hypothetical protein
VAGDLKSPTEFAGPEEASLFKSTQNLRGTKCRVVAKPFGPAPLGITAAEAKAMAADQTNNKQTSCANVIVI